MTAPSLASDAHMILRALERGGNLRIHPDLWLALRHCLTLTTTGRIWHNGRQIKVIVTNKISTWEVI